MHQTKNDLPSNTRNVAIDLLNARLADAIDLALLTKQAHWNLKGPRFIAIHEMLDGFAPRSTATWTRWQSAPCNSEAPPLAPPSRWRKPQSWRPIQPISTRSRTTCRC